MDQKPIRTWLYASLNFRKRGEKKGALDSYYDSNKLPDVVPLDVPRLLVFFRNGTTKVIDSQEIADTACAPFF